MVAFVLVLNRIVHDVAHALVTTLITLLYARSMTSGHVLMRLFLVLQLLLRTERQCNSPAGRPLRPPTLPVPLPLVRSDPESFAPIDWHRGGGGIRGPQDFRHRP